MEEWKCKKCENKYLLKIEADFAVDPIWCNKCGALIDITTFPLLAELRDQLVGWGNEYGKWIDLESDSLAENGIELQEDYNRKGLQLTEKVKNELGEKFKVRFKPSSSAESYKLRNW